MVLPLTPSDRKDFQDKNPIKADDEFIVSFANVSAKPATVLADIFNRHGKGKATPIPYTTTHFVLKDIDWAIVNAVRAHPDVVAFGPNRKIGPA